GAHLHMRRDGGDLAGRHPHGGSDGVAVLALREHAKDRITLLWCHLLGHQRRPPPRSSSASFSRNHPLIIAVRSSIVPSSSRARNCSQTSRSNRRVTEMRSNSFVPFFRPTARSGPVTQAFLAARL